MKLDDKTKELIAVGASVSANCQPCLDYHYNKALENGSDETEITEAINTGAQVRRGAAAKIDKFLLSLNNAKPSGKVDTDCGCSN